MGGASSATEPAGAGRTKRPWLIRLALGWLLLVCALGGYWVLLHQSHREQLVLAVDQARLRATQTAEALTMQVGALIGGVDYMARHLSELGLKVSPQDFRRAAEVVEAALPAGALLQVSVVEVGPASPAKPPVIRYQSSLSGACNRRCSQSRKPTARTALR